MDHVVDVVRRPAVEIRAEQFTTAVHELVPVSLNSLPAEPHGHVPAGAS
ncbi:hypothetical protein ABT144_34685 [Streptomyces sp. NPDC002039]